MLLLVNLGGPVRVVQVEDGSLREAVGAAVAVRVKGIAAEFGGGHRWIWPPKDGAVLGGHGRRVELTTQRLSFSGILPKGSTSRPDGGNRRKQSLCSRQQEGRGHDLGEMAA